MELERQSFSSLSYGNERRGGQELAAVVAKLAVAVKVEDDAGGDSSDVHMEENPRNDVEMSADNHGDDHAPRIQTLLVFPFLLILPLTLETFEIPTE
jgi:hypothetical protein